MQQISHLILAAIISFLEGMLPAESSRVNNDLASEESEGEGRSTCMCSYYVFLDFHGR